MQGCGKAGHGPFAGSSAGTHPSGLSSTSGPQSGELRGPEDSSETESAGCCESCTFGPLIQVRSGPEVDLDFWCWHFGFVTNGLIFSIGGSREALHDVQPMSSGSITGKYQ